MPDGTPYVDSGLQTGLNNTDLLSLKVENMNNFDKLINEKPYLKGDFNFFQDQAAPKRISDTDKILNDLRTGKTVFSDYINHPDERIRDAANSMIYSKIENNPFFKSNVGGVDIKPYDPSIDKFLTKKYGFRFDRDNEDFYYRNVYMQDSWFMRNIIKNPIKFIGRIIPGAVLKFGEGLGYVGSMLTSIGSDNYWADVADNGFSKWLNGLEQKYKDQIIPVYRQAGFDQKGFFSKLTDWSFWNEDIADAVAFMASAAVPAMGFAKLGRIGAIAEEAGGAAEAAAAADRIALNAFGRPFSATSWIGRTASNVGMGSWAELSSWAFNTGMEASMEAQQVFQELTTRLKTARAAGDPRYVNLTDEDIRKMGGKMAAVSIAANFGILGISNAFENTLFFKPFKEVKGRAALRLGEDWAATSPTLGGLESANPFASGLSRTRFYGTNMAKAAIMEGLWEENAQLAVQRMNQGDSDEKGFIGFWRQLAKQTINAFSGKDEEALENIGLGALIGIGGAGFFAKAANERRGIIENTKAALDHATIARQKLFDVNDIWKKTTDGHIEFDEKGNPQIDNQKLALKVSALEKTYGQIAKTDENSYFSSDFVKYEAQKALSDYIHSIYSLGIRDISGRFSSIKPEVALMFGMNPKAIKEQAGEYRTLAKEFEQKARAIEKLPILKRPPTMSDSKHAELDELRKGHIYSAETDNVILGTFIKDKTSKLLANLNISRNLENASISQFPVDYLNSLIYQQRLNSQLMESKEFKELSDMEQQYHRDRDIDLTKQIENYKKAHDIMLTDSRITPSGFYMPTITDADGTKRDVPMDKSWGLMQKSIADYSNMIHKNNYIISLLTAEEGYSNYDKWSDTPLSRKLKKVLEDAGKTPIKEIQKKYTELKKGDFDKIATLVGKMVFGENQEYSPEENQLRANYPDLISRMVEQYEAALDNNRRVILRKKLAALQNLQEGIARFVQKKETVLAEKRVELEILQEELEKEKQERGDVKTIAKALTQLQTDIGIVEDRLQEEKSKLQTLQGQVVVLEQEIESGSFRGAYGALQELKEEIDWTDRKINETTSLLDKVKKILRRIIIIVKKLFPSFDYSHYDRIFGDEVYGQANREAYATDPKEVAEIDNRITNLQDTIASIAPTAENTNRIQELQRQLDRARQRKQELNERNDLISNYDEIRTQKEKKAALEQALKDLNEIRRIIVAQYNTNKAEIDAIIQETNNYYKQKYMDLTGTPLDETDAVEEAIAKSLLGDKDVFPSGSNSGGGTFDSTEGFDGNSYQRPLHTKFFTTTFPFISETEERAKYKLISEAPKDVQDYFHFVNYLTNTETASEVQKKLGKGILKAIVVTKNNVSALKLGNVLEERKKYFEIENPALTHFEVVPVVEDGGYFYFVDKELNRLGKVGEEPSKNIVRAVLRTAKFTDIEEAQYAVKHSQEDMDNAVNTATTWRAKILEITKKAPDHALLFNITRGIPNIQKMQDGERATNPVVETIIPEEKIDGLTVRVFSKPNQTINKENIVVPVGRPFIFTTTGPNGHEQLHAADNQKLTPDQVNIITAVMIATLNDHVKTIEERIAQSTTFPKNLKDKIKAVGGIKNLDDNTKKQVILNVTKEKKGKLFNANYTNFLSSIIYGFGPLEVDPETKKLKRPGTNQIYIKGSKVFFGIAGLSTDITTPEEIRTNPEIQKFLSDQYHNIKFYTNKDKANKEYIEYYLDKDGKIVSRTWKTYSHYLLMDKYPDGKKRTAIPITTSIKTKEQQKTEKGNEPYYPYLSRGITLFTESSPAYTKERRTDILSLVRKKAAEKEEKKPKKEGDILGMVRKKAAEKEGKKTKKVEVTDTDEVDQQESAVERFRRQARKEKAAKKTGIERIKESLIGKYNQRLQDTQEGNIVTESAWNKIQVGRTYAFVNHYDILGKLHKGKIFEIKLIRVNKNILGKFRSGYLGAGDIKGELKAGSKVGRNTIVGTNLETGKEFASTPDSKLSVYEISDTELVALEGKKEEKPDNKEKSQPDPDGPDMDFPATDLFRISTTGPFKAEEDLDAVIADIRRMLPQFPVQRLRNVIKVSPTLSAWGQFVNNTILLYELAEEGTGYHEAFEAVANRLLSDAEWRALSREFRSRKGTYVDRETQASLRYADATEKQIKEQLAEEFRDYKLGKKEPVTPQAKSFLRIIWDFIKSLFISKPTIDEIFLNIDKGKFANRAVRASDKFVGNYRFLSDLPVQVRRDLFDGATGFMASNILNSANSVAYLDEIELTDEQIYEPIRIKFEETKDIIDKIAKESADEIAKENYKRYSKYIQYALDNWGDFVAGHKESIKHMRIKFEKEEDSVEDNENRSRNDYLRDEFTTSGKENSSKSTRFLFGTLLKMKFKLDKNGKGITNDIGDRIGGKITYSPNTVFMASLVNYDNYMLKALEEFSGMNDFSRIEEKMRDLAGITAIEEMKNPEKRAELIASMSDETAIWTSLYMRLFGLSDKVSEEAALNLQVKVHNYLSKHSPEPLLYMDGTIISSIKRPMYETITRTINASMSKNFSLLFRRTKENNVDIFVPNASLANSQKDRKTGELQLEPRLVNIDKFTDKDMLNILEFLGLRKDYITDDFLKAMDPAMRNVLKARMLTFRNHFATKKAASLSITSLDVSGYITNLVNWLDRELKLTQTSTEFFGLNNQMRQKFVTPSFVSRLFSEINSVKTRDELFSRFPQLETVFAKDSILLSKLFDKQGNRTDFRISLGYMEGVKAREERQGTRISKLQFNDRYYVQFNASLSGIYYTLPGDSETEWVFNFGEFVSYSENMIDERGIDIIKRLFIPKLKSEIEAVISGDRSLLQFRQKHAISGREIGKSLRFFKDILQYRLTKKKDGTFAASLSNDLLNDIYKAIDGGQTADQILSSKTLSTRIINAIRSYLEVETQKGVDTMLENQLVISDSGAYIFTNLNSEFLDKNRAFFTSDEGMVIMNERQMRGLMEYQKINSILANMESFKLIWGDPAQYKDWVKRAKSLLGPYEQVFYDRDNKLNSWLNKNKNVAELGDERVEIPSTDMFYTDFSDSVKGRTVEDVMVTEVGSLNDLIDKREQERDSEGNLSEKGEFLDTIISQYSPDSKGNSQTNETDGQSIGSLQFARQLLIKSGWRFTKEMEKYYQYDTALMRSELSKLSPNDRNYYRYTDPNLKELDNKIIKYYTDNPPLTAISPVKTIMPYVDENGNQKLFKHSIHFVSYQIAKEFDILNRYVDMLKRRESTFNFRSSQKIGLLVDNEGKITDYYQNPFTITDLDEKGNPQYEIDLKSIGIQQETQDTSSGQTLGTQTEKDINLNLFENGIPLDFVRENLSPSELKEEWETLSHEEKLEISDNYKMVYGPTGTFPTLEGLKMRNLIAVFDKIGVRWDYDESGNFTYEIDDLSKIHKYIDDELHRLEVDENTINTIQLTEDKKSFVNPAETIPSYVTIANRLWSMADKAITRPTVNGKPFIQVSSIFFNKGTRKAAYKEGDKWVTVNTLEEYNEAVKSGKKMVMTSSELKFYTVNKQTGETDAMEVYLPNIYLRKVNTIRKGRGLDPLTEKQLMDHLNKNPKLLEGIGFRIPTQATSSLDFFKIKGFLPESFGNAIVVPSAITTKAGSDFDVDKLNTYLNNWKLDKNGFPVYEEFKDDSNSTIEERYTSYVRSQEREYNSIYDDMKQSSEYQDVMDIIEGNAEAREQAKDIINNSSDNEKEVYMRGLAIFHELPLGIKQQYYSREQQYRLRNITGVDKTLDYIVYTNEWIKTFTASEGTMLGGVRIQQEVKDKKTGKTTLEEVTIYPEDVIPIFEDMIQNYNEFLSLSGITQNLINEYLQAKEEMRDENTMFMKDFSFRVAQLIAEFNGYKTLDEFARLPIIMQNTKKALENRYFESIRNVLKSPNLFAYLLSPNSISHIKEMRDIINKALGKEAEEDKELNYSLLLSTEYIADVRNQFVRAKSDIGIPAVSMTNYANSQVTGIGISAEGGIKSRDSYVLDTLNEGFIALPFKDIHILNINGTYFIPISVLRDRDGKYVMDKLSSYINGFVDVTKNPYITEIGMHTDLVGTYLLLERMGLTGKTTALFMFQPVIREFLKQSLFLESKSYFSHSLLNSQRQIIDYVIEKYAGKNRKYDPSYKFTDEQLIQLIKKGEKVKSGEAEFTEEEKYAQYIAFVNFLKIRMFSNNLLETVQASNHDTASIRSPHIITKKDIILQRAREGNTITAIKEGKIVNGAAYLRNNTYVGVDIAMLKSFNSLLSKIGLFALQKENPQKALYSFAKKIMKENEFINDDDFITSMREAESSIIDILSNNVLIGRETELGKQYNELYRFAAQLFVTDNPNTLKKKFEAIEHKYQVFKKNFFLKNLKITSDPQLGIDLMDLAIKPASSDIITKEMLTEGLLELANSKEPELQELYRAIVYGAFIQFGIKFTRRSFVNLIPVSVVADKDDILSITDITRPALINIDNEDFSNLEEQIQRAKYYKPDIVPEKLQRAMHFVSPNPNNTKEYALETKPVWKNGSAKLSPTKSSQIFFGRRGKEGDIVPHIHPAFIWGGYVDNDPTRWEDMPNIINIPAVRPEFLTVIYIEDRFTGNFQAKVVPAPIVKSMQKRNDYSYLYDQLYKKVGVENPEYARSMISSSSKGRKSMNYLYKPIHKSGHPLFNEIRPVQVTSEGSVIGSKSILNFPKFIELEDGDLVSRINNQSGKIAPVNMPNLTTMSKALKPIAARPSGPVEIQMSPENIVRIAKGTKTTTVRTFRQSVQIGIKPGKTAVRKIGGDLYNVTNRGLLSVEEAGGLKAMLASEGVTTPEALKYKHTREWIEGKGKLYVYDIKPITEKSPVPSEPIEASHKVKKVISGGQHGGDIGGLRGARRAGIATGGTAPKGFIQYGRGSQKELLESFGLVEGEEDPNIYPKRTMKNVDDSGGTVAILWGPSTGTEKTIGYAQTHKWQRGKGSMDNGYKPILVITTRNIEEAAAQLRDFVIRNNIEILNVAGHRETSQLGIEKFAEEIVYRALSTTPPLENGDKPPITPTC